MELSNRNLASNKILELLRSYISEDQLNSHINNIQDLLLLRTALELKVNCICHEKHALIFFPIKNILDGISTANIDEVYDVLHFALKVQSDESQYMLLLEYINKNLSNYKDECHLICILKLLQLALSICESEHLQRLFKQFSENSNFHDIICSLLSDHSKIVTNLVNVYILPKYLSTKSFDTVQLLEQLWKNVVETKHLNILCDIPEFFLATEETNVSTYSLVNIEKFWSTLQECLSSNNSSIQKQALYLLKRAIYSLKSKNNFELESKVIFWDSQCKDETYNAWQNLFMLFEIAREKQLHLIEPAYPLLLEITILHCSWLMCIYKILLGHPHSAVSAYAILAVIESDWCNDINVFKEIIGYLLPALNKIEYTQKEELWKNLQEFAIKLSNEKFIVLLQATATITWVPPIYYQFCESIFNHNRAISIPFDLTENILNSIEKLPHKFIRNECTRLAVSFMNKAFLSEKDFNFKDYITLIWILYGDEYFLCDKKLDNFEQYVPVVKQMIQSWILNKNANLKEVKVVLQITELCSMENDWLEQNLLKPFVEKEFASEVLDNLCLYLYKRYLDGNVINYLHDRLVNLKLNDGTGLKNIISLLIETENNEREFEDLFKTCTNILLNEASNAPQMEVAFRILIELIEKCEFYTSKGKTIDAIIEQWKHKFLENYEKSNAHICLSFLQLYSYNAFYGSNRLYKSIDKPQCITSEKLLDLLKIFEKIVETQSNDVLLEIFKQLKYLLELNENEELILAFANMCCKKLTELKRTDIFKIAVENFANSIFSNYKICNHAEDIMQMSNNSVWALLDLAKSSEDVAYSLASQLHNLSKRNTDAATTFIPIAVELLLFGDVLKKDLRAEYTVCQKIFTNGGQPEININNPNFRKLSVRRQAVNIIQNLLTDERITKDEQAKRADALTSLFMDKYSVHFNKRYFADSQIHLQKLRILQGLLVVHNYVVTQKQPLIDLLMNSICKESHQISVKFLIIWLLVRLLHDDDRCLTTITSKMECTSKAHSSTIIAFIPILYHVGLWRNDESFFLRLFEIMLPWTMGAHFNLRLHAQEGIAHLYKEVCKRGFVNICEKYKVAFACITDVLKKTEREIDRIDEYIFSTFNVQDHYHLRTVYFDIPFITNLTCDEYENFIYSPEFNTSKELLEPYKMKQLVQQTDKTFEQKAHANLIQKKITPWTKQFDNDMGQRKIGELIVVGSLINKAPNLGGLSRTCEIFAVKQLVINTFNVVKSHEFQSVSMSSEKWIDIVEIKVDHLQSFFLHMKEKGYFIVGVEQTSDSVQLNTFEFPKKCLLLLGNEKEGIPPNLLSLIDFCVEIPQFGVVRSLNVHVAASTFIWEYTKQHMPL